MDFFAEEDSTEIPIERVAICVWPEVGLRAEPTTKRLTKEGKPNYLAAILYGEKVEIINPDFTVNAENKTWIRVRLKDGQEGWVHEYLFEKNARLAVMIGREELYRRPDQMTLREEELEMGEIVVVLTRQGNWIHISGREKRKKGWLRSDEQISLQMADVKAALLYERALDEKNPAERKAKLQRILDDKNLANTAFRPMIEEAVKAIDGAAAPASGAPEPAEAREKLFISATEVNLYSQPEDNPEMIVGKLQQGDVCFVLQRGERSAVGDLYDRWYRVRFESQEGWVYGYYTSLRVLE